MVCILCSQLIVLTQEKMVLEIGSPCHEPRHSNFILFTIFLPYLKIECLCIKGLRYAEGGIRTPTSLRTLAPEASASANSATSALLKRIMQLSLCRVRVHGY